MKKYPHPFLVFLLSLFLWIFSASAGDMRIAFIGDSITAGNSYAVQLEVYLRACAGHRQLQIRSFGYPGDTSLGFLKRLDEVLAWKPTLATLQFGMNDGFYGAYTDWMGTNYVSGLTKAIKELKGIGCTVILATPTYMDPAYGRPNSLYAKKCDAETYNKTLGRLAEFAKEVARNHNIELVEIHQLLGDILGKCKDKYGEKYVFCGTDGIHPTPNGHLVIMQEFLKVLPMNSPIADITLDCLGDAQVSDGHTVKSWDGHRLVLESTKYPYCLTPQMQEILPFIDFQERFNRFNLKVRNLDKGQYHLYWGGFSKEFSSDILISGINLIEEFPENPLSQSFRHYYELVASKQRHEVALCFEINPALKAASKQLPEDKNLPQIRKICERQLYFDAESVKIPPFIHTIDLIKISN